MRQFGSIIVITLLLIAYGRCVADQYGVLHTTDAACCQTIDVVQTHCDEADDDSCAGHDESSHDNNEAPSEEPQPTPCQLCFILSNDGMQIETGVKIPHPVCSDFIPDLEFHTDADSLLGRISGLCAPDDLMTDLPAPPEEPGSLFRCLVIRTAPVRGPSIA